MPSQTLAVPPSQTISPWGQTAPVVPPVEPVPPVPVVPPVPDVLAVPPVAVVESVPPVAPVVPVDPTPVDEPESPLAEPMDVAVPSVAEAEPSVAEAVTVPKLVPEVAESVPVAVPRPPSSPHAERRAATAADVSRTWLFEDPFRMTTTIRPSARRPQAPPGPVRRPPGRFRGMSAWTMQAAPPAGPGVRANCSSAACQYRKGIMRKRARRV
ncbi:MAG: hypothetical protein D6705_12480 [Deltaproteobacteria bacterium]|nr:MAG: hypothetical protein D6705_12480 [Deltaproteobacteria bacterium]